MHQLAVSSVRRPMPPCLASGAAQVSPNQRKPSQGHTARTAASCASCGIRSLSRFTAAVDRAASFLIFTCWGCRCLVRGARNAATAEGGTPPAGAGSNASPDLLLRVLTPLHHPTFSFKCQYKEHIEVPHLSGSNQDKEKNGALPKLQVQERALRGLGAAMRAPIAALSSNRCPKCQTTPLDPIMARLDITEVRLHHLSAALRLTILAKDFPCQGHHVQCIYLQSYHFSTVHC